MITHLEAGKNVLRHLEAHGYSAYFVGGFVRDFLLGIPSDDIDIATSARPDQVKELFKETRETGARYGTVTILQDHYAFEVTTFRSEGAYIDHRHPEAVAYSTSLEEDCQRRDFTMNALAMDKNGKVFDFHHGKEDMAKGLIRSIGVSDTRFKEDALRILRAFRFVSKLGFAIEPETLASISRNRELLKHVSNERVLAEFRKILAYPHPDLAFRAMVQSGVSEIYPDLNEGIRLLAKREHFTLDNRAFFGLCFYLSGSDRLDDWRFSNKEKSVISRLSMICSVTEKDTFNELLVYANGLDLCLMANEINRLVRPENDQETRIRILYGAMPIHRLCDLAFKGQDILEQTDLKDASVIGDILDDVVLQVITLRLQNDYDAIRAYVLASLHDNNQRK